MSYSIIEIYDELKWNVCIYIYVSSFLQEIYKDRKKFSKQVFEVASSDLVNMGITVVSYTLKDIRDDEVNIFYAKNVNNMKNIWKAIFLLIRYTC